MISHNPRQPNLQQTLELEEGTDGSDPVGVLEAISSGTLTVPSGVTSSVSARTIVVLPVPQGRRSLGPQ